MTRRARGGLLIALLACASVITPTAHAALPTAIDGAPLPSLAPVIERSTPAVVNISTATRIRVREHPLLSDPFFRRFFAAPDTPRERRSQSLGSGVIVDSKRGYVLTNNHVIDKADIITVTLSDGRSFRAELIGSDPATDIAVLQVSAERLTAVRLGDSDRLRVGDFVLAIGNPFGLGQTVTSGIVSALGRSGLGIEGYEDFIQTDASINPGNSGGALINLRGELVGINTAILAPGGGNIGIGFAIPVNMARAITDQIIEHGAVLRGSLGAQAQDLTHELLAAFGLTDALHGTIVSHVTAGSPADKAGLRVGDVITAVNGREVQSADELRTAIGLLRAGADAQLSVLREGRELEVTAILAATAARTASGARLHSRLEGLTLSDVPGDALHAGQVEGVLIVDVVRGSPAWSAGLRSNDVITSVNRVNVSDVEQALAAARLDERRLLLNIRRGETALFLLIQ